MTDPGLALLLDASRLSELVGTPLRVTRLRPKPGVSCVGALVTTDGTPWGWVRTLSGPARAKADKGRAAATLAGPGAEHGEATLPGSGTLVQWGTVPSDPRLGRYAARLPLDEAAVVLRHNPLRRLVVRQGNVVHRVTASPHRRRLTEVTRALAAAGVPLVTPVRGVAVRSSHVTTWPWVEGRDAAGLDDPLVLTRAGAGLARLHATPPPRPGDEDPSAAWLAPRGWADAVGAAGASVTHLGLLGLPDLERWAGAVLDRLRSAVPPAGEPVVSHGDLSPDQFLVTPDRRVLLTDLDRAAVAPRELDLASLLATCLLDGSQAWVPVLEGYAEAARLPELPDVPGAWVAAALLARVLEPWRMQVDGWAAATARLLGLAQGLLADRPARGGSACGGSVGPPPGPVVPPGRVPEVVDDGTDVVRVDRAWPGRVRDGIPEVVVEGRDAAGRLRAGTWSSGRARLLPPGVDPALPGLAGTDGELVVHRAGRRAVLRRAGSYAKVVRPGRGADLVRSAEVGHRLAVAAGLGAPRVLRATDDVVELSVVPGRPLHELADGSGWTVAWGRWAEAWARLQGQSRLVELPSHTDHDEAGVLRTWAARSAPVLGGTPWPARMVEVAGALSARADDGLLPVPAHRDLHDKQLLWDGRTLSVLDLDTACLAHPALDPANLAAHASLRHAQRLWSEPAAALVRDRAREVARAAQVDDGSWALAEAATVARLVAVYAFRPRWRTPVLAWADGVWSHLVDESSLMNLSPVSPPARAS